MSHTATTCRLVFFMNCVMTYVPRSPVPMTPSCTVSLAPSTREYEAAVRAVAPPMNARRASFSEFMCELYRAIALLEYEEAHHNSSPLRFQSAGCHAGEQRPSPQRRRDRGDHQDKTGEVQDRKGRFHDPCEERHCDVAGHHAGDAAQGCGHTDGQNVRRHPGGQQY